MSPQRDEEAGVDQAQHVIDAYGRTLERIDAAAERVGGADAMRRAALREIGAALGEYRALLASTRLPTRQFQLRVEDVADRTGISRRTISHYTQAPGDDATTRMPLADLSDQALARLLLAYREHSGDMAQELHRRYPMLQGLLAARRALWRDARAQWERQHEQQHGREATVMDELWGGPEQPRAVRVVLDTYWAHVRHIAAGRGGAPADNTPPERVITLVSATRPDQVPDGVEITGPESPIEWTHLPALTVDLPNGMPAGPRDSHPVTVIHRTREELEEQRVRLLGQVGMSYEELSERAATYRLSLTELDIWHTLKGIDYLLEG